MYEKELQRILTASQNNALTFFVGAGVSALSGAPTWKRLIHAISDRLGQARKDEYSSDEYLQIPQMFYYSLGENKEEYYTFVKAQLHSSPMLPNVIHREMLNLNPVSFITTNYDTLLEDAAVQYCQSFKVVSRDEDVPTIFGDRFILNKHPYEELDQVGYWCLINVLNAKDFREFLGNSAAFDFYCEYTKFDFNKFDVPWLLNLYPHTLEQIAKNEKVKGCVRVAIANALNDGEIALSDSQRLQSILIKHFC